MKKFHVTINRQFGSLGRPIAQRMAEQLNVEFYDRDIIEIAASQTGLPLKRASDIEESASKNQFLQMCFPLGIGSGNERDTLFQAQRQILLNLADARSCILVGRCSDYILRHAEHLARIFIYAPYEKRLKNCTELLHMDGAEADRMIKEVDAARDEYQLQYAHYKQGDFRHTDILIDSSMLGVEETAKFLSNMIIAKFG